MGKKNRRTERARIQQRKKRRRKEMSTHLSKLKRKLFSRYWAEKSFTAHAHSFQRQRGSRAGASGTGDIYVLLEFLSNTIGNSIMEQRSSKSKTVSFNGFCKLASTGPFRLHKTIIVYRVESSVSSFWLLLWWADCRCRDLSKDIHTAMPSNWRKEAR